MEILSFVLLAISSYLIAAVIHELGHVITGFINGFKFQLLVVGPFGLKRNEEGKIVFYFEKNLSFWGGIGATTPVNESDENFKKFGRILLGGPIFSIVFGLFFLPFGILADVKFSTLLGAMLIGLGVVSLIPMRNGAFYTDGGRWLRMNKNESTKAVELALWDLTQNSIINQGYANLNFENITRLINDPDMRTKYLGHFYAYYYYKENKHTKSQAIQKNELDKLKNQVPKSMVSSYRID